MAYFPIWKDKLSCRISLTSTWASPETRLKPGFLYPCNRNDGMFTLSKRGLLKKNKSFQTVYRMGKSYANRQLVVYILPNKSGERRVGFAAGKRLGNAVKRNRVKRLLREAYRLNQHHLVSGFDLIIVGRQTIAGEKLSAVQEAFVHLCRRAGIMKKQAGTEDD